MSEALITVVLCNWKHPNLLKVCVNSLLNSFTVPTEIKVVLNESNYESVTFLQAHGIDFVSLQENRGTVAVDLLTPLIKTPYVVTINDDQLIHPGWQDDLLLKVEKFYPCMVAVKCVEPEDTGNSMVTCDNLGHVLELQTYEKFIANTNQKKYQSDDVYGYNHPAILKTEDWKAVGGYSCGLAFDYFGLGGYCADDYFNYKIFELHKGNFRFIISGDSFAYHQVSFTGKRLPNEIKNYDAHSRFVELTGITTQQFRKSIDWGQKV